MEQAVLVIPDSVAVAIRNGGDISLSRRLLELATIKAYELNRITGKQVMEALGLPDRELLYQFFKENDVRDGYTVEDLERDTEAMDAYLKRVANTGYSREALELMAVQGYQVGELTEHQIQEMLGLETRFEVHAFLKERGVPQGLSASELEENRKGLEALLSQRAQ